MKGRACPESTRWWWIRHAPVPDAAGRIIGRRDFDCDTTDERALAALVSQLPAEAVAVVSPLTRTRQTYQALCRVGLVTPPPVIEPDFAEQSFGSWEGLGWSEMQARDPDSYAAFWQDPVRQAPPQGESFTAQIRRTAAAIERLLTVFAGRDVIAVAHGGTIRAATACALALPPEIAMGIDVDTLSLTRLDHVSAGLLRGFGGSWRVRCLNAPARLGSSPRC